MYIYFKKLTALLAGFAFLFTTVAIPVAQANHEDDNFVCSEEVLHIVSNTDVLIDGENAVATYVHPAWTAAIDGATWIWESAEVLDPLATTTVTFTSEFEIDVDEDHIISAEIEIAADDEYQVWVNGTLAGSSAGVTYNNPDTIDIASLLIEGTNTIVIEVINHAGPDGATALLNPAGLLFGLHIVLDVCEDTVGHLNVIKTVVGGDAVASDFSINISGTGVSTTTATSSVDLLTIAGSAGTMITLAPGAYSVTETAVSGYNVSYSADCSGSIEAGQTKTCTVTNTAVDIMPDTGSLTIIKQVINDNGGTGVASDFNIIVNGSGVSTTTATSSLTSLQISGNSAGTMVTLAPGAYSVVELSANGYNVSYSADCSGSIEAGQSKTCVVTNNDIGTTTGGGGTNVNVNPNITVNPVFNNIIGGWPGFFNNLPGNVLGAATSDLSCGPALRSATPGQLVTFTASGGSGDYVWTAPNMTARSGNQLTVFYPSAGTSSVTLTSAGQSVTCNVNILGSVLGDQTGTPGLPNTGMGGNLNLLLNLGVVLALSGITTMILRKRALR
jgi:hypothetical protein